MQNSKVINLVVGGNNFCFKKEDLERFPDSFFAHFLKDEWTQDRNAEMHIDRSGLIFYNVFSYIVNDSLGFRGETFSLETLVAIRREADFYNLPGMIAMCDERITSHIGQWCSRAATNIDAFSRFTCEPENSSKVSPIFEALNDAVRPATVATSTAKLVFLLPSFGALLVPSNRHNHKYVDVSSCFSQYIRLRVQNECGIWLDGQDTLKEAFIYISQVDTAVTAGPCLLQMVAYSRELLCTYRTLVCTLAGRSPQWAADKR